MPELVKILETFTPGAYGIWAGVLMFAAWWLREWRETRKLSLEDRVARREGYAKELEGARTEIRNLGGDLRTLRSEYDNYRVLCHAETDQLRKMAMIAETEIEGLKRKLDDYAIRLMKLSENGGSK